MDAPTTYAEIYLHGDGKKLLSRRVYDEKAREQVRRRDARKVLRYAPDL